MFYEVSAKENYNIKKMFYSAIADLPFFEMFENLNKTTVLNELGTLYY